MLEWFVQLHCFQCSLPKSWVYWFIMCLSKLKGMFSVENDIIWFFFLIALNFVRNSDFRLWLSSKNLWIIWRASQVHLCFDVNSTYFFWCLPGDGRQCSKLWQQTSTCSDPGHQTETWRWSCRQGVGKSQSNGEIYSMIRALWKKTKTTKRPHAELEILNLVDHVESQHTLQSKSTGQCYSSELNFFFYELCLCGKLLHVM